MEVKRVKSKGMIIPAIAMRGLVIFPSMIMHFDVERSKSIAALEEAMDGDRKIFLVAQREIEEDNPEEKDLFSVGVVAEIQQLLTISKDTVRVLVVGLYKAKMLSLNTEKAYLEARVSRINNRKVNIEKTEEEAITRALKQAYMLYCDSMPKVSQEAMDSVLNAVSMQGLFDAIIQNVMLKFVQRQNLLEITTIDEQCKQLVQILINEAEVLRLECDILEQVRDKMDQHQHEYFLREQMKLIAEQLGEDDEYDEENSFEAKIKAIKNISDESREKLLKECDRYYKTSQSSQEANVIRNYLETCLSLPWDEQTKDKISIPQAKKILDRDHYGMEKIKDRVLESLSVRKLNPDLKGQILCLVGPPGVGKTSIARAIAEAVGKNYVRISLGGVRDESDIRGHRKTYVGAMPGRIINAYIQAKSNNPLILFDEIDKMSNDFRGDPSAAMLEVLDSEQNSMFRDHYVEVPFDLSNTLFVTTANTLDTIPAPLLDRMEIIELSSYTREEKFNIAKKHLVKKQREKHGLNAKNFKIQDLALYDIIDYYVKESGVRKLELKLATLCRKSARKIAENKDDKIVVTKKNIEEFLGPRKYKSEQISKKDDIGVVNGLAWTSVGGELLPIEAVVVDGTGKIEITGNLGEVMTESAKLAVTYARTVADSYKIDKEFYKNKDIHIHAPEGAVPKDGPSAGVTMATALISALTDIPVKRDIAMTGEISLRGKVLPIGGLKEKTMAAYRAGVKKVLIPSENFADLAEVDDVVKSAIKFITCDTLDEVLDNALVKPKSKRNKRGIPSEPIADISDIAEEKTQIIKS